MDPFWFFLAFILFCVFGGIWCGYRADMGEPLMPNFITYPLMMARWKKDNGITGNWEIVVTTKQRSGQNCDYSFVIIPPEGVAAPQLSKYTLEGSGYEYGEFAARRKAINIAKLRIMNYVKNETPTKVKRVKI